ncbi:MAG: CopG family transcriptional regulator [Candidatus Auribacterota bacterium]|jgi:hypothetical protein|uniref:CopG family transcriptional regulator n=1 Tax=Candidatus Auribacter fodinae TaxID=2093366 RepID=A0A3A4R8N9_9BACT|nr:MAG: CopG family transcriptional regulator [Candidatus Auribacter fodinae]
MTRKMEIITFKVDKRMSELLNSVPNRSDFIRSAILSSFENVCPLCRGTGLLTPDQRKHWQAFSDRHTVEECHDCRAVHLVCNAQNKHNSPHKG